MNEKSVLDTHRTVTAKSSFRPFPFLHKTELGGQYWFSVRQDLDLTSKRIPGISFREFLGWDK